LGTHLLSRVRKPMKSVGPAWRPRTAIAFGSPWLAFSNFTVSEDAMAKVRKD